jgi:hypothetical protein
LSSFITGALFGSLHWKLGQVISAATAMLTDSNSATPLLVSEETIHFIVRSQITGTYGSHRSRSSLTHEKNRQRLL